MRAPFIPLLLATASVVGSGCASAPPQQEPPVTSSDRDCGNGSYDPLHAVSSKPDTGRDPEIESLLNQSADPRLAWVNRQMYQTLRSLDVELRREQRIAACERPQSSVQALEARSSSSGGTGSAADAGAAGSAGGASAGGVLAGGGIAGPGGVTATTSATAGGTAGAAAMAPAASQSSIASGASPAVARSTLIRKSSLSASGGGGNGATAQKVSVGSDNDIVARRLRKAAEQETDPALRTKLWKEYSDYRQGMSAK